MTAQARRGTDLSWQFFECRSNSRQGPGNGWILGAIQIGGARGLSLGFLQFPTHPKRLRQQPVRFVTVGSARDRGTERLFRVRKVVSGAIENRKIEPGIFELLGIFNGPLRGLETLLPGEARIGNVRRLAPRARDGPRVPQIRADSWRPPAFHLPVAGDGFWNSPVVCEIVHSPEAPVYKQQSHRERQKQHRNQAGANPLDGAMTTGRHTYWLAREPP